MPTTPVQPPPPSQPHPQPLPALPLGRTGLIVDVTGPDEDAARLKRLGLCAGRRVTIRRAGDPMIVQVLGSRLGVAAALARRVLVDPAPAPTQPTTSFNP